MMKKMTIFAILLSATVAQAKPWSAVDLKSWNALKNMCDNHEEFGAQVPPEDLQVKCQTKRQYTAVVSSEPITFKSTGSMIVSFTSSKANMAPSNSAMAAADTTVDCPVVAKFKQDASGTFPTTCTEINGYKGSFVDYCVEKLNSGNYEGAAEQIPGTEKSLCAVNQCQDDESLN